MLMALLALCFWLEQKIRGCVFQHAEFPLRHDTMNQTQKQQPRAPESARLKHLLTLCSFMHAPWYIFLTLPDVLLHRLLCRPATHR